MSFLMMNLSMMSMKMNKAIELQLPVTACNERGKNMSSKKNNVQEYLVGRLKALEKENEELKKFKLENEKVVENFEFIKKFFAYEPSAGLDHIVITNENGLHVWTFCWEDDKEFEPLMRAFGFVKQRKEGK